MVVKTLGMLLLIEAVFMAIPTLVSWYYAEHDFLPFLYGTLITFVVGLIGFIVGRSATRELGEREGYVIVALVWVVFSLFGMIPYIFSSHITTVTDAFFECMAGFTTTGSTILTNVDQSPHGCLLWRSIGQWLGGMGIIVFSLALLPMFGLNGTQLYAAEVTGLTHEKLSPRIADTAKRLYSIYIALTVANALLLRLCGMNWFDAICHAMTTIATGGCSTHDMSIAYFNSPMIEYVTIVFMFLSGINFSLLYFILIGKVSRLWGDEEIRWYAGAIILCTMILSVGLFFNNFDADIHNIEQSFRMGLFVSAATLTSTGFVITDYLQWPSWMMLILFFMMIPGACAGSTSGGVKWVRIMIFVKNGISEFTRRIHPNAVLPVKINDKLVSSQTIGNLMAFMLFYIAVIVVSSIVLCCMGLSFDQSIVSTVSAIGNYGASIDMFGPTGNYADFPMLGKWWMSFVMLVGRLEIFTILMLFTPALWKK